MFEDLLPNTEEWRQENLNTDPEYFVKLAQGQNPEMMIITCVDSRVTLEKALGTKPGEVFTHRNIAGIVDSSTEASINYAVAHFDKLKEIVVVGHTGCGGVKGSYTGTGDDEIDTHLKPLSEFVNSLDHEIFHGMSDEEKHDFLVGQNTILQCKVIENLNIIRDAHLKSAFPKIKGAVFNLSTGKISMLDPRIWANPVSAEKTNISNSIGR